MRSAKRSQAPPVAKIFICYRRDDTASYAGRIHENLRQRLPEHEVFMDLGIGIGGRIAETIESEISSCAVLLVVIGPDWLNAVDERGDRRLDDPKDFVRREIDIALQRTPGVLVIPLLVRRAAMPTERDLPEPLAALAGRRGFEIRDERWDDDIRVVADELKRHLSEQAGGSPIHRRPMPVARAEDRDGYGRRLKRIAAGVLLIALVAVIALIATAVLKPSHDPADVNLGAIFALSEGPFKDGNDEVVLGARFAVKYINDMHDPDAGLPLVAGRGLPHLDGAKLRLVVADAGTDPGRCAVEPAFNGLVDGDHVAAVIGANESTVTLRAILAADRRGVPLVNSGSSATNLTTPSPSSTGSIKTCDKLQDDPRPSPWFFHIGPNDTQAAEQFFSLIDAAGRRLGPVRKVAILQEGADIFGNGGAAALRDAAESHGIEARRFKYPTVAGTSVNVTDDGCSTKERQLINSLRPLVGAVRAYNPDVVFAVSYLPDAITIVQRMNALKYKPRAVLVSGSSFTSPTFIDGVHRGNSACGGGLSGAVRATPVGIIAQAAWASQVRDPTVAAPRIAKLFEQEVGRPMSVRSAGGFTAVMTAAQAIDKAGSVYPADVRDALRSLDVAAGQTIMPWGGISFDSRGENTRSEIVLQQYLQGRYRVVYPPERATASPIFPLARAR